MAQNSKFAQVKADLAQAHSAAEPSYYDTHVMFAGYPGSVTAKGTIRRSGRPLDPILEEVEVNDLSDLGSLASAENFNPDN